MSDSPIDPRLRPDRVTSGDEFVRRTVDGLERDGYRFAAADVTFYDL